MCCLSTIEYFFNENVVKTRICSPGSDILCEEGKKVIITQLKKILVTTVFYTIYMAVRGNSISYSQFFYFQTHIQWCSHYLPDWIFFLFHTAITTLETILGVIFGVISGVLVALVMSLFPFSQRFVMPTIVITQALPVFAIAPLLVLWFGFGLLSKVFMATLIIFFPVASNFFDGLNRTESEFLDLGRLYNLNKYQLLRWIKIPSALPALSSGLRVSVVFCSYRCDCRRMGWVFSWTRFHYVAIKCEIADR